MLRGLLAARGGRRWALFAQLAVACALVAALAVGLASCGGETPTAREPQAEAEGGEGGVRLPPGLSEEDLEGLNLQDLEGGAGGSAGGGSAQGTEGREAPDPARTAEISGARFTVVDVTRNDSNKKVIASGQREVLGDYLEVELAVENVGDGLVDFSQYSFRLESPSIQAEDYRSYYGDNGVLGKYVSDHTISAVLLDYADLTPVLYKLKRKEVLEGVFLFYDLNPQSAEENAGFTADIAGGQAFLVIHKARGEDAGEEVRIGLAGLMD